MYYLETRQKDYQFNNLKDLYKKVDELDEINVNYEAFEDCEICNGEVEVDVLVNYCSRPVSDCCGGCTERFICDDCEDGKIEFML